MRAGLLGIAITLVLSGCGGDGASTPDAAAEQAAQAAQQQANAEALRKDYDAAVTVEDWEKARTLGYRVISEFPGTPAAAAVKAGYDAVKAKSDAKREEIRQQYLWIYQQVPAGKGMQTSARMDSGNVIRAGGGETPVQLIFRDHPEWKRSTYIVLQRGDIDCYRGCKIKVTVDGKARQLDGLRPDTKEAISMFVNPDLALWRAMRGGKKLTLEIPVKGEGKQTAEFDIGGLDRTKMPANWQ